MSILFAPYAISHYIPDRRGCNPVVLGKCLPIGFTIGKTGTDSICDCLIDFIAPKARTTLSSHVSHVISICTWEQMGRIATGWIIAVMEAAYTWGQGAVDRFPCESLGVHFFTLDLERPVPASSPPCPRPASIRPARPIDFSPKQSLNRWARLGITAFHRAKLSPPMRGARVRFTAHSTLVLLRRISTPNIVALLRTIPTCFGRFTPKYFAAIQAGMLNSCYSGHVIISLLDSGRAGGAPTLPGFLMPNYTMFGGVA